MILVLVISGFIEHSESSFVTQ